MMSHPQRRILVTGGAGFIGSNFIRHVLEHRPTTVVVNYDLLHWSGHLATILDILDHPRHHFVRGDICDRDAVKAALRGCDAVVNMAAETHVDRSIADSTPFVRTNVLGTQVLIDAAREAGIGRFVQVSTDEVYGSLPLTPRATRFTENSPLKPNSPYAASKAGADGLILAAHHTFGFPGVITRSGNNIGPFQFPEKIVPLFIVNLIRGLPVPLYGDGRNVRDWIHVIDHAEAVLTVLERGRAGAVYNIGAGNEHSNAELTRLLVRLTGRDESFIRHVADRPGHDLRYALDSSRIQQELGWRASRSEWPGAVAATVEWYQGNRDWWMSLMTDEYREYIRNQYGPEATSRVLEATESATTKSARRVESR